MTGVRVADFAKVIKIRFQLDIDDDQHNEKFFKPFIQEDWVLYSGFINRVLTSLFPALEDSIE